MGVYSMPELTMTTNVVMQKSKSSTSVSGGHSGSGHRKMWRSRSKSQSRVSDSLLSSTCTWTPQGNCKWSNVTGKEIELNDSTLLQLSDVERRILQKVALARLQALNLGVSVRIPKETVSPNHKPKRRAYLLKKKAMSTGFFDSSKDPNSKKRGGSGAVFGVALTDCVVDRGASPLQRRSHHGSRSSFSSLIEGLRGDKSGSCESLNLDGTTSNKRGSLSVLDRISCSSTEGLTETHSILTPTCVPSMVSTCIKHLETHGLHTLGLFRVSSSKKRVRQLREALDSGQEIHFTEDQCPHDVAALLKEFFRDLPEPLLCRELYPAFLQTQKLRNRRLQLEALQHLVQLLPQAHRDTLFALLIFLAKVAENAPDHRTPVGEWVSGNKMDSNNLATLFAPNLLHSNVAKNVGDITLMAIPEERVDGINVVRCMIDHYKELFEVPSDLLDEMFLHMMDSHPDMLERLLRQRAGNGEEVQDDVESCSSAFEGSEGSSVPRTPTEVTLLEMPPERVIVVEGIGRPSEETSAEEETASQQQRFRKREEILHEGGGTGGHESARRLRDRGREKDRSRRQRERRMSSDREDTTHSTADQSWYIRSPPGELSSNIPTTSTTTTPSPSVGGSSSGDIITASLRIPVPFSLDDTDIPFIEEETSTSQSNRQSLKTKRGDSWTPTFSEASTPGTPASWCSSPTMSPPLSPPATVDETPALSARICIPTDAARRLAAPMSASLPSSPKASAAGNGSGGGKETKGAQVLGVHRSKTTDFASISPTLSPTSSSKSVTTTKQTPSTPTATAGTIPSSKKYVSSRHLTTRLPDIQDQSSQEISKRSIKSSSASGSTAPTVPLSKSTSGPVWKRKEIISSQGITKSRSTSSSSSETFL